MSTPAQRALWAFDTEYRAERARREEVQNLYAAIEQYEREIAQWRKLAEDLIRAGAVLPST